MTFETFRRARVSGSVVALSVRPTGVLRMSAAAFRALGKPHWVALLHDAEARKIALREVQSEDSAAHPVRGQAVSAAHFLRWAGIDYSVARSWNCEVVTHNGVLMLIVSPT